MRPLTQRQTEALTLLMQGHSHASAAVVLNITERTMRFHVQEAKRNLEARTLVHLVANFIVMQQGQTS